MNLVSFLLIYVQTVPECTRNCIYHLVYPATIKRQGVNSGLTPERKMSLDLVHRLPEKIMGVPRIRREHW